jgi:DNA-binding Xre family transcriptional regulator
MIKQTPSELPFINLKSFVLSAAALKRVPIKIATHYGFAPLALEDNELTIAVESAFNIQSQDEIRMHLGVNLRQMMASREDIADALKRGYGMSANTVDRIHKQGNTPRLSRQARLTRLP